MVQPAAASSLGSQAVNWAMHTGASGLRALVLSGSSTTASAQDSITIGGLSNLSSGLRAFALSGSNHQISGVDAGAIGGSTHIVSGPRSLAIGGSASHGAGQDIGPTQKGCRARWQVDLQCFQPCPIDIDQCHSPRHPSHCTHSLRFISCQYD